MSDGVVSFLDVLFGFLLSVILRLVGFELWRQISDFLLYREGLDMVTVCLVIWLFDRVVLWSMVGAIPTSDSHVCNRGWASLSKGCSGILPDKSCKPLGHTKSQVLRRVVCFFLVSISISIEET